jgi:4-hydroxy-tetrahydrodipicolinate synthase
LHTGLFVESNPIPVKWAMQQMGLAGPGIRLPLVPLDAKYYQRVRQAMADAGVGILGTA